MRNTVSKINREEQVKVVIRLKPQEEPMNKYLKCVYIADQQNHLVVQTGDKKEIFVFDHVAPPSSTQLDIYQTMGQQMLESSLQGYNCSIFAFGQTGAGKTYSILGDIQQLKKDIYSESRGILPRLVEQIFQKMKGNDNQRYTITCSYMQIYNQQIFDLLSNDKKVHQIRENKRGIYVEGLYQCKLNSYKQSIALILEGIDQRKMGLTSMNTESSRSHVIFTLFINSEIIQDDKVISRHSKLNIIDLAGSQRIKHTNVQGERLKQGCNINKSLHVLGNVINSLVQSSKKKKYIPYRDSKLTYFLKDSLGGNSITKLLANIHCGRQYFGDTLSTLMFAKRIKNIKMKVEINQNESQNFDALRKQVRKLRQQLAQAKYFKPDFNKPEKMSLEYDLMMYEKYTPDNTEREVPKLQIIQIFQENQMHYKALLQIYEEHFQNCQFVATNSFKGNKMLNQWKKIQKKNVALSGLIRCIPSFTKIYKQNLLLKQQSEKIPLQESHNKQYKKYPQQGNPLNVDKYSLPQPQSMRYQPQQNLIIQLYQQLLTQTKQTILLSLQTLQKQNIQLQHQCKLKDKKIKQLLKKEEYPPNIERLLNQNQYLNLNILNLQNQIKKLGQNQNRLRIQLKQTKKQRKDSQNQNQKNRLFQSGSFMYQNDDLQEELIIYFIQKIREIQKSAKQEAQIAQSQRLEMQIIIKELRQQIQRMNQDNNKLRQKYERSKSKRRSVSKQKSQTQHNILLNSLMPPISKNYNSPISPSHDKMVNLSQISTIVSDNQAKELIRIKVALKSKQKQVQDLKHQLQFYKQFDYKIQEQFKKPIQIIVKQYRQFLKQDQSRYPYKYNKNLINRYKQEDILLRYKMNIKNEQKQGKRSPLMSYLSQDTSYLKESKSWDLHYK